MTPRMNKKRITGVNNSLMRPGLLKYCHDVTAMEVGVVRYVRLSLESNNGKESHAIEAELILNLAKHMLHLW